MTEPRRVLIDSDYGAGGIWWVLTKEEKEAPAPPGRWSGSPPPGWKERPRAWSDRLTGELLDGLQAWNDSLSVDDPWDEDEAAVRMFEERGRELAVRVQDELGTDGWEVLYILGGRVHRVHPPGDWPVGTWEQELLGYAPIEQLQAEEEARMAREHQQQTGADAPPPTA